MIKFEYDKKERFLTVFTLNKSSSLINLKFKFPKRLNMKLSLIFFLFLFTLSCKKENPRKLKWIVYFRIFRYSD